MDTGITEIKNTSLILTYTHKQNFKQTFNLYFVDQRHFGLFEFTPKKSILNQKIAKLGPDLLNQYISFKEFKEIIMRHSLKNICKVLMEQSIFSGIGNYLKSEILYDSKIHPLTTVNNLTESKLRDLYQSSRRLIKASYLSQGNSLRHYKNVDSKKGLLEFKLKFMVRKRPLWQ